MYFLRFSEPWFPRLHNRNGLFCWLMLTVTWGNTVWRGELCYWLRRDSSPLALLRISSTTCWNASWLWDQSFVLMTGPWGHWYFLWAMPWMVIIKSGVCKEMTATYQWDNRKVTQTFHIEFLNSMILGGKVNCTMWIICFLKKLLVRKWNNIKKKITGPFQSSNCLVPLFPIFSKVNIWE